MASDKKKKSNGRKVHIDNLYLVKKLEPEYAEAFFDFEEVLLKERMTDEKINVIANIALAQLQAGMEKKKKPALIISKEKHYQSYITKMSKGKPYAQMKERLLRQGYEKLTISGIWLVFCTCILLLFFKNLISETYLINFSVDLIAAVIALVLAVRNYQIRYRIIAHSANKSLYLAMDVVTIVLCLAVKLLVKGNFDVSYLLLVVDYFVTKRRYRKELEERLHQ